MKKKEKRRNKTLGALPGLTETVGRLWGRNTGRWIALLEMAVVSAGLRSSQRTNDGDPRHWSLHLFPLYVCLFTALMYTSVRIMKPDEDCRWTTKGKPTESHPEKPPLSPLGVRERRQVVQENLCAFQMQYHCFRFFYSFCVVRSNFVRKDCGQIFSFFNLFFYLSVWFWFNNHTAAQTEFGPRCSDASSSFCHVWEVFIVLF